MTDCTENQETLTGSQERSASRWPPREALRAGVVSGFQTVTVAVLCEVELSTQT